MSTPSTRSSSPPSSTSTPFSTPATSTRVSIPSSNRSSTPSSTRSSTPTPAPLPPSPAILNALERRMSRLSITIATHRADAREKLPSKRDTFTKDNEYTLKSEGIQRAIEKGWIGLRRTSLEARQGFLERMEKEYAELVEGWRKEGGM